MCHVSPVDHCRHLKVHSPSPAAFLHCTRHRALVNAMNQVEFEVLQAHLPITSAGIGMGCIAAGATQVTDGMMAAAARAVADCVTDAELQRDSVLPDVDRIRCARDQACRPSACSNLPGVTLSQSQSLSCQQE